MSSGTQKGAKAIKPGPTMIRPFFKFFHCFFGKFNTSKGHSEINWPVSKSDRRPLLKEPESLTTGIRPFPDLKNHHIGEKIKWN